MKHVNGYVKCQNKQYSSKKKNTVVKDKEYILVRVVVKSL